MFQVCRQMVHNVLQAVIKILLLDKLCYTAAGLQLR